jgi:hypothetical protein
MPTENAHDPRTRLVREKYFSLRPKPLERWLWQQGLPQAAERVFWLHWEEGMRSGDWCSQLPLRLVATQCCIDTSTVTRAYQLLKSLDLIRRQDPGRDPANPFQQATAITEVRIPKALLARLSSSPNRFSIKGLNSSDPVTATRQDPPPPLPQAKPGAPDLARPSREHIQATWNRTSASERSRYFHASRNGAGSMAFDPDSLLTPADRRQLEIQLQQMAGARNLSAETGKCVQSVPAGLSAATQARRLPTLLLARIRQLLLQIVDGEGAPEVLRQMVWAAEEGALRRFEPSMALNIALKKVREGAWTRPHRMPPNWSRLSARAQTCIAA